MLYDTCPSFIHRNCFFTTQAEFGQCKMGLFEKQKQLLMQEKRRYCALFEIPKMYSHVGIIFRNVLNLMYM